MNIQEIKEIIPHRYPLLLIDRVDEMVEGERIIAKKNVTKQLLIADRWLWRL